MIQGDAYGSSTSGSLSARLDRNEEDVETAREICVALERHIAYDSSNWRQRAHHSIRLGKKYRVPTRGKWAEMFWGGEAYK